MGRLDTIFEALAHPVRRRILSLLKAEGELAAGDLAQHFDIGKPTLSHHLRTLLEAGLVDRERRGRNLYYRVQLSALEEAAQVAFDLLDVSSSEPGASP